MKRSRSFFSSVGFYLSQHELRISVNKQCGWWRLWEWEAQSQQVFDEVQPKQQRLFKRNLIMGSERRQDRLCETMNVFMCERLNETHTVITVFTVSLLQWLLGKRYNTYMLVFTSLWGSLLTASVLKSSYIVFHVNLRWQLWSPAGLCCRYQCCWPSALEKQWL